MRRLFFAIFCLWIFNNVAFAALCDARYYNDNGSCVKCSGFRYCPGDDIAHDCPSVEEHKRTTFPDSRWQEMSWCSGSNNGGIKIEEECLIICSITDVRGRFFDYAHYNTTTQKYDTTALTYWHSVKPGYYLSNRGACGAYAYYKQINVCPAGSYCPGKSSVICNSGNQSVVHTTTFGLETCPNDYPNSADGAGSINQCYLTTTAGNYVATENAPQTTCAANGYCPGDISVYYGTTGGRIACPNNGFSPAGLSDAVCYPHILHVGDSNVYLKSTKQTTPLLNIKIGNDVFYANMTTERTKMNKDSSRYLHINLNGIHYYVCDDTICPNVQ